MQDLVKKRQVAEKALKIMRTMQDMKVKKVIRELAVANVRFG